MEQRSERKWMNFLFAMVLVIVLLPAICTTALAATENVTYLYYESEADAIAGTPKEITKSCTVVENSGAINNIYIRWNAGCYVVNQDTTITYNLNIYGDVDLILMDGKTLTVEKGILINNENKQFNVNIYGQSGGTGNLIAYSQTGSAPRPCIGGTYSNNTSTYPDINLNIHGGIINAVANPSGSQNYRYNIIANSVTIWGGEVNLSANSSYGIGTVRNGGVTVYGGSLTISNKEFGIVPRGNQTVTIKGGSVEISVSNGAIGYVIDEQHNIADNYPVTVDVADGMTIKAGETEDSAIEYSKEGFQTNKGYENKYVYIGKQESAGHTHSFTYSASGATITATCGNTDGQCTLDDSKVTLTISAPTLTTYDGQGSASATLVGPDDFYTATGKIIAETDIRYVGQEGTDYTESAAAPTNAGDYTAKITLEGLTASVNYTITPAIINSAAVEINAPVTNNVLDTSATSTTENVSLSAVSWNPNHTTAVNATAYTATVTASTDKNHAFADSITVTVNGNAFTSTKNQDGTLTISYIFPQTTLNPVEITTANKEVTYSPDGISIPVIGMFSITEGAGTATYRVDIGTGEGTYDTQTGKLTVTNCGTFTVSVITAETDTHAAATANAVLTVNKANAVSATITANNRTYDKTEQTLVTVTGEPVGGTMLYALGENSTTIPTQYEESIPAATNAGTYYVWYKVLGNNYYNDTEPVCVSVTISMADNPLSYAEKQNVTAAFSTSSQTAALQPASNGEGNVRYAITNQVNNDSNVNVSFFTLDESGTTLTIAGSTPPGTYSVIITATAAGNDNYKEGTKDSTVTVTINKADNPLTYDDTQTVELTFSKEAQTAVLKEATDGAGDVTYAIQSQPEGNYFSLSGTTLTIAANTPAGTYTVGITATAEGNDFYNSGTKDSTVTVKVNEAPSFPYMVWDEESESLVLKSGDDACKIYTLVNGAITEFEDGQWYVVNSDVTIQERIKVSGEVHLILADGASLTASKGISVNENNTLNIYAQSTDEDTMGVLNATGDFSKYYWANAGIGGDDTSDSGTIIINGGKINATGSSAKDGISAAAIGGGSKGSSGTITINGGIVSAIGYKSVNMGAAGIGGGSYGSGGMITINGGTITAVGGGYGAGIGSGSCFNDENNGCGGTIVVNGGSINATGGDRGAAIGGGDSGKNIEVIINNGTIEATGGYWGAGIGGGCNSGDITVTINNGTIEATGGHDPYYSFGGAGVGGGRNGSGGIITIKDGTINANGGNDGAGIGGGAGGNGGMITVFGGTVTATGGKNGAGIGGYNNGDSGCTITISGGAVTATGGSGGAGIGGGNYGDGAEVIITGGNVEALSGGSTVDGIDSPMAIGHGMQHSNSQTLPDNSLTVGPGLYVYGGENKDSVVHIRKISGDYARMFYMQVNNTVPVHTYIYSDDGPVITATSEDDFSITLTIVKPTMETYGQTGENINAEATLDGLADFNEATRQNVSADAIKYYKATKSGDTYTKSGDALTAVPTDAGDYIAELTIEGVKISLSENGNVTAFVGYTIEKAENPLTYDETQTVQKTFSTDAQTADLSAAANGVGNVTYSIQSQPEGNYFSPLNGTTLSIAESIPVGSYTVVVRAAAAGDDNYKSGTKDSTVTVTISKAENPLTYDETQTVQKTFSTDAQTADLSAAASGVGDVTYSIQSQPEGNYFLLNGTTLTIAESTPAGNYTVVVRAAAAGDDNYESGEKDSTVTVTISKADPTVTVPSATATYGQTLNDVNLTNPDGNMQGTWAWKDSADTSVGNAGSNKFTAVFTPDDAANYNSIEKEVTLTVNKANPTVTSPSATATYGQTLADVTLTNPDGNIKGKWEWVAPGTTDVGIPGEQTFMARFTPDDTNNYNSIDVPLTVTVGKASNPANVIESAAVKKGGNTVDLANNIKPNGASGTISYEIPGDKNGCSLDGSVLTSGSATGTVKVKVTVAADNYYEALEKIITVTITDKEIQTISVDADPVTVTFGETGKKISATASGGGAISYAVKEGSANYIEVDRTTGELTIKAVPADGKAYVTVTAAATDGYEAASVDVTVEISKAEASAAEVKAAYPAYNGTAQPLLIVTGSPTGGEMQYALGQDSTTAPATGWGTSIPTATDAGIYYVWYKVKGDENHSDSDPAMVPVMIAKAQTSAPDPDEALTVNYPEEKLTAKDGYEVSSAPGATATDPDLSAILDDPNPTVYVRKAGDKNHEPSEWVLVSLTPRPGAPEGISSTNAANGTSADGAITGVDNTMEYSDDGGTTWKDVPADTITGLNPGAYQVRVKATDAAPAGKTTEVTVGSDYRALDETSPVTITKGGEPIGDAAVEVGDELSADCDASDVVYQWYRADEPIEGADDPTYTVTDADLGKTIKVKVTQTKKADGSEYGSGTEPSKESVPTSAVTEEGDLEAYKEQAKAELEAYRNSKDNAAYDGDGVAALDAAKTAGDSVIDQASNREKVDAALAAAKARLDAVQTMGQEYTIDVTIVGEGKVDVDVVVSKTIAAAARPGNTVMLNVIPFDGYKLNRLTYVPEGGASVNITGQKQFTMPAANVKVVAVFVKEEGDRDDGRGHMNFFRFENADVLPKTGFSAVHSRALGEKPLDLNYQPLRLTLEVPSASIATGIVSVPFADGEYPVTWLGTDAGLLEGSALPGMGQAVITGHNHLNTSAAGPFAGLSRLKEGDRVFVRDERGAIETFVVYANAKVAESDINAVNELISADPLSLTLITCEDERPEGGYANRRVIAAKPL